MEGVTVVNHPLVQHKLTLMRSKEISTGQFRQLLQEISPLMRVVDGEEAHATAQLAALGIQPSDLTHIVATHFHFDHGGGLPEFPGVPMLRAPTTVLDRRMAIGARGRSSIA